MADKFKHLPNTGSLFMNSKKEATNKQPDFNGTINVEGKEFYISAWKNEITGEEVKPAINLKVTPKP